MPCVNGCLRQVTFEFDFKNFKTAKLPHKNQIDNTCKRMIQLYRIVIV